MHLRFLLLLASLLPLALPAADRPNILWITAEDMSPALGSYGDPDAKTPNLDAFAKESVRYTRAFAAAPVCSPSRSTLVTGMWAPSLGTSQMRSTFPLPSDVTGFPTYLREAGYFTTNNVKTDYNTADAARLIKESWDESSRQAHWRSEARKDGQPFFSVFNHEVTHQSRTMVWPYEVFQREVQSKLAPDQIHDPATIALPPYYPDTPVMRRELARFHDCVSALDTEVGALLKQLEEDGLADDTIVFFYSDHGSGMPRHKRLLHDSGMRVPLLVRFPEKFKHLAPAAPGETVDRLVTFADFGPTVLALTGTQVPDALQGEVFLGPEATPEPEYVYGFRDRIDEVFDLSRSVRSARYLYIRNHMPHLSWGQRSVYSDLGKVQQEIFLYASFNPELLTKPQQAYVSPTRPAEEFYDVEADPQNLANLLDGDLSPEQQAALDAHRAAYAAKREEILDLGALPETIMVDWLDEEERPLRDIALGKTNHRPDLARIWAAADLVGKGTREELLDLVHDGDAAVRYWAIVGLRHAFPQDEALLGDLVDSMDDISAPVRIEMAAWMAEASDKHRAEAVQVLGRELVGEEWWTVLRACRAVELLGEKAAALLPVMETLYARNRSAEGVGPQFISFSSGAFLKRMGMPTVPWDFSPKKR
ncbi:MAG TPA: sulfatase [Bacteroidia bacterium]|nr:sulfatase [Bacteroidia bacterium]